MDAYNLGEILQHFYEISGMDIAIVSTKNRIIARKYSQVPFCSCIHKSEKCLEMCEKYPQYQFEKHKGYGTKLHYEMLDKFGVSDIHRMSFLKKYFEANKNGK